MKVLAVIPARYASTRFPGKPLALLQGKPIIQWVWERVSQEVGRDDTIVATDDERILTAVTAFGGNAMMTCSDHKSGTDRCGEVLQSRNPQCVAQQIQTLLQNPSQLQSYAEQSRKAAEDLCWQREEEKILQLYRNSLNFN